MTDNPLSMEEARNKMQPTALKALDNYAANIINQSELFAVGKKIAEECAFSAAVIFLYLLKDFPESGEIAFQAGYTLYSLEDFQQAANLFNHAREIDPDESCTHYGYAISLLELDRLEEAEQVIDVVIELEQEDSTAMVQVSEFYNRLTEIRAQKAEANKAQHAKHHALFYAERALERAADDQEKQEARSWLQKIGDKPGDAGGWTMALPA